MLRIENLSAKNIIWFVHSYDSILWNQITWNTIFFLFSLLGLLRLIIVRISEKENRAKAKNNNNWRIPSGDYERREKRRKREQVLFLENIPSWNENTVIESVSSSEQFVNMHSIPLLHENDLSVKVGIGIMYNTI